MNIRLSLALAVCVSFVTGCASKAPQTQQSAASAPMTDFEKAKDPEVQPNTHFAAGQLAESQAHLQEAAQQYRAALKQDPKMVNAMFRLGIVYTQLESYPKAIEMCGTSTSKRRTAPRPHTAISVSAKKSRATRTLPKRPIARASPRTHE